MAAELIEKYGSLVQFGVDYMVGFSQFSDEFIGKYYEYKPDIIEDGYSPDYQMWIRQNKTSIVQLYNELNYLGLIPTHPTES